MVNNFKPVQAQNFSLAGGGAVAGATSLILKSFKQIDGTTNLTMTDFGTIGFATLEPGNGTFEEQISFTGVTQNANGTATITGVSTVLMVSPYTATSGLAQTHAGSTTLVLSNTSGYYDQFPKKAVDSTISGKYTFPGGGNAAAPVSGTVYAAPTADLEYASKKYVDEVAIAGAPDANTTTKGIVQEATQAQVDAKTQTGSTGAKLFQNLATQRTTLLSDYVVDSGAADAYVITPAPAITGYVTGQRFSFRIANTNATTTPTLAVNGLSATLILVRGGSAPAAGDLKAGMIAEVEKAPNGFEMMVPVGNAPATQAFVAASLGAATHMQVFTATGTWTRPSTVTKVKVRVVGGGGGGGSGVSNNAGGGGGGAGGYAEAIVTVSGNVTVTIGAAGAAPTAGNNGGAGGNSSFAGGATVTANGGAGGTAGSNGANVAGGAGGTTSNGDLGITGGTGGGGQGTPNDGGRHGGAGGSNPLGIGGIQTVALSQAGNVGAGYGAGGSGGIENAQVGAAGTAGIVIVEWTE